ncbi:MAG: hypothetical protein HFJ12_01735 [Bacilli bacterium]|nr:hypothetical protein [Bacilli bacterium]
MVTRCGKIFLVTFIIICSIFTYRVQAYELDGNYTFGVEKRLISSGVDSCSSILGDVNDEDSVAWLVQRLLNYLKILGPTIAIVLGSIDFGKAIITSDEENMKKAQNKFVKRIIAAIALFFVPLLTQILLGLFGITSDNSSCGLK